MDGNAMCPTCHLPNEHEGSVYCSNLWHLTGENRIPEPHPYRPPRERIAALSELNRGRHE
jgi:hypothetical protein